MKVLFVSSGNAKDGISPIVWNQGQTLINQGIVVDFFTIKGKGTISYLKHVFSLRNYLIKNNYDIIHAHYGFCGVVALLAKKKEKVITSFMGDDILGSNKSDGHVTYSSKIQSHINVCLAQTFYCHSIVKSNEMLKLFKRKSNISLLPNGVDLNLFKQMDRDTAIKYSLFDPDKKHILFVSDTNRIEKNYSLAKNAVDFLQNQNVELNAINGIPGNQLVYYYNSADLLLLTSMHEGSPNVIKEAMACNCPIVCTDVGDVNWVLGNTEGCYLTSFKVDDVADKINKALEFSEKHGRTKGRERIIELGLNTENIANKILEAYHHVLKTNN